LLEAVLLSGWQAIARRLSMDSATIPTAVLSCGHIFPIIASFVCRRFPPLEKSLPYPELYSVVPFQAKTTPLNPSASRRTGSLISRAVAFYSEYSQLGATHNY